MAKGSVSQLGPGRFQARRPGDRVSIGVYPTREEAAAVLAGYVADLRSGRAKDEGPNTFAKYGERVIEQRKADGYRTVDDQRRRFKLHLAKAPFAGKAIDKIESADVVQWLRILARKDATSPGAKAAAKRGAPRKLSRSAIKNCLTLASAIFAEAQEDGLIAANPCHGLKIKKREETTQAKWGYLTAEEQLAVATCEAIPIEQRLMIRIAIGTGLRQGELANLHLADVHAGKDEVNPHVVVRFGSQGKAPKNGKIREVPLFGDGLVAMREWLAYLPTWLDGYQNAHGLACPTERGSVRAKGKPLDRHHDTFAKALRAAGVKRPLHWHDLRHTCAVSLVRGWWGHTWRLEEVSSMLGHSSIGVTERYAHLGETPLKAAARATDEGYGAATRVVGGCSATAAIVNDSEGSRLRDLNSRPTVYEPGRQPGKRGANPQILASDSHVVAAQFLELLRAGHTAQALAVGVTLAAGALVPAAPPSKRTRASGE